jgi:DNA-directed RNA polymerase
MNKKLQSQAQYDFVETVREQTVADQIEQEEMALKKGQDIYMKQVKDRQAELPPGMELTRRIVEPLSIRISQDIEEALSGQAGRGTSKFAFLSQYEPDMLAFITAKVIIGAMISKVSRTSVAMQLGKLLEEHDNFEQLRLEAPREYKQLLKKIEKSSDPEYRHIVMRKQQQFAKVMKIKWDTSERLWVGEYLIECCQQVSGMFDIIFDPLASKKNKKPAYVLTPRPETIEALEKAHEQCSLLHPLHEPMLVEPKKWSTPFDGGYYTRPLSYHLIKTDNLAYLSEVNERYKMPMTYGAVNMLQGTKWKINQAIMLVQEEIWAGGGDMGGLPTSKDKKDLVKPPKDFDDANATPAEVKQYKKKVAKLYEDYFKAASKRLGITQRLVMARKYAKFSHFHFPYSLDWRGRIYPVTSGLNPQGDDASKALLTFAEPVALGEHGLFWLMVHGANTFGVDKVSYQERIEWVIANEDMITECAVNPLDGSREWAKADSPLMFLAFCKEYTALLAHMNLLGQPAATFMSDLPVSWDGACNGLQQASALRLSESEGSLVGLIPSAAPKDIYAIVAKHAQTAIDGDAEASQEELEERAKKRRESLNKANRKVRNDLRTLHYTKLVKLMNVQQPGKPIPEKKDMEYEPTQEELAAAGWRELPELETLSNARSAQARHWKEQGLTRKIAKLPVMTFSYNVSYPFGVTQQLQEALRKIVEDKKDKEGLDVADQYPVTDAGYLAEKVYEATTDVVKDAKTMMDWLGKIAAIATAENLPVTWVNPAGMYVKQDYRIKAGRMIDFTVAGKRMQVHLTHDTTEMSERAMIQGLAPNWTHSMDAAHLCRSVMYAAAQGVRDFAMIHDSYGAHAGHAQVLHEQLREAFIDQYTPDLLEDFRAQIEEKLRKRNPELADMLPPPLPRGVLDLAQVRNSPYFFA